MSTFAERKAERTKYFDKYAKGWAKVKCVACNGSGRYDHDGSPKCSGCDGTGKVSVSPTDYQHPSNQRKD